MRVEWFGQSAFTLSENGTVVAIDPFGDMSRLVAHGIEWSYPPIEGVTADLLLVTHEHGDHNGVEAIGGEPAVIRSTAGRIESPIGEVVAVASEHDSAAGTQHGPNTIFCFELGGMRVCHFGDFGQSSLREEQAEAIGEVDLLILPVGGGPTIGADGAAAVVERLRPSIVVPMHYRTARIGFLEPVDAFLDRMVRVERIGQTAFDTADLSGEDSPLVVVPATP
jgi:L-ascorbate metabolism protein UlaG (beta-lactamase superfamily)